ncbi:hypothetical protein RJ639_025236 [Escallonia herrerae]|uniref:Uncharacterized protein n=1 Tax=Escallonia herrerae TaxID=1293975 RepID=A0AA88S560_9ASTE|nr:hypothetical protein RJ639_025236 [Escallonia herrerae]
MGDFTLLSDSDDDRAVEELLAQAKDHSVLEQVAAINFSGCTSDSALPTHLETRFRKLKSFPSAEPTQKSSHSSRFPSSKSFKPQLNGESKDSAGSKPEPESDAIFGTSVFPTSTENPVRKMGLKPEIGSGFCSSPSKLSDSSTDDAIFKPSKRNPDGKTGSKSKSRSDPFRSRSDSSSRSSDSGSPPRKSGCLFCSPKRVSRKKSKDRRVDRIGFDWRKDDGFLSDLGTFSTKEQEKMLKKAMIEEEKISCEAEKIVKWARQESMRIDASGLGDELSDNESNK